MLYEIINPSDPYTIEADSLDIAFMACVLLGNGQYEFRPFEDGGTPVPFFMFGGTDEWCKEHLGKTFHEVADDVRVNKREEMAKCLDSCLIGSANDRRTYYLGLELIEDPVKRERWWFEWHDKRRSSLNDIGGRAHKMAQNFRKPIGHESASETIPAPQQVFGTI